MKALSKTAQKVFTAAIAKMGNTHHVKIDTKPGTYMALVVEAIGATRFTGTDAKFRVYSFAHYGEQNGDAMRDPDVCMLQSPTTGELYPIAFRNDYAGVDQEALAYDDAGDIRGHRPKMQRDITAFCTLWAANLRDQQGLGK